jgi:peptidoglycan/LPS O-acetylase OafA/YrhL
VFSESAQRLIGLQTLRGYAVCATVLVNAVLLQPVVIPAWYEPYKYLPSLGIPLMFVISAFAMNHGYKDRLNSPQAMLNYYLGRFFRLAPLFYALLLIWSIYFFYLGSPLQSWKTYALNLSLTFGLVPSLNISIVPAGWPIGVAAIFYALFPILSVLTRSIVMAVIALVVSLFVAQEFASGIDSLSKSFGYYFWSNIITNMPYFLFGLLAQNLHQKFSTHKNVTLIADAFMLIAVLSGTWMIVYGPTLDGAFVSKPVPTFFIFGWGLTFSALVLAQTLKPIFLFTSSTMAALGKTSFGLYLVHAFIIYATPVTPMISALPLDANIKLVLYAGFTITASAIVAAFLYAFVEAPGQALGRKLASKCKALRAA